MVIKAERKRKNNKILHTCECCYKKCNCSYIHIDCIFEFLRKHDYIVFDLNLDRVFGFKGGKKW